MNPPQSDASYTAGANGGPAAEDASLMRRIASGDESALALLYDRWVQPVYSLVLHLLDGADEAEDVVEETFWQAWRKAEAYDPARGTVQTWLFTIGRSRALDRLRARRRQREEPLSAAGDTVDASYASDPGRATEGTERRALVLRALNELPDEQRRALALAYYKGLSQTEIAEYTRQPLGTVKTRMRLGMQKLREALSTLREEAR